MELLNLLPLKYKGWADKGYDPELIHENADRVLCVFLESKGCKKLVNQYKKLKREIPFWYA